MRHNAENLQATVEQYATGLWKCAVALLDDTALSEKVTATVFKEWEYNATSNNNTCVFLYSKLFTICSNMIEKSHHAGSLFYVLKDMPQPHRLALFLDYYERMNIQDISATLLFSTHDTTLILQEARMTIRHRLDLL